MGLWLVLLIAGCNASSRDDGEPGSDTSSSGGQASETSTGDGRAETTTASASGGSASEAESSASAGGMSETSASGGETSDPSSAEAGGSANGSGGSNASGGQGGSGLTSTGSSDASGGNGGVGVGANGSGGAGGNKGSGGGDGTGGAGSSRCSQAPSSEVFDFGSWDDGAWAADGGLSGGAFIFTGSGSSISAEYDASNELMHLTGTVNDYAGWGMWIEDCTDASAYEGISFVIGGTLGTQGTLEFQVQMTSTERADGGRGECVSICTNNGASVAVPASPATVFVPWSELSGGEPTSPADPSELLGFTWQFECVEDAACALDVTLDDLAFY